MVSDKAVDSFIVGNGVSGSELDNDFSLWIFCQNSFVITEEEDVVGVGEKLELSLYFRGVDEG